MKHKFPLDDVRFLLFCSLGLHVFHHKFSCFSIGVHKVRYVDTLLLKQPVSILEPLSFFAISLICFILRWDNKILDLHIEVFYFSCSFKQFEFTIPVSLSLAIEGYSVYSNLFITILIFFIIIIYNISSPIVY